MKNLVLYAAAALCVSTLSAQEFKLGGKVADFTLQTAGGAPAPFAKLKGDTTVLMFISTKCPISNDYNDRMKAVYNDYASKGVKFVFVNSNSTEPGKEVEEHAKTQAFPFAVYKDADNAVADRFGAQVTPEAFVLDKSGTIVYHGYVDDSRNPARIQVQGLRNALDAVLAGKPVSQADTKAFGCTIKRVKKAS